DQRSAKNASPAAPSGLTQLIEKEEAPEDAKKAVGIPERESDAESDVADREDSEGVGYGPEASGQQRPNNQMRRAAYVGANGGGSEDQGGQTPACKKDANNHNK